MKKAIIIHGWGGSPKEGWRPWLVDALEQCGWSVMNPSMPEANEPTQDKWVTKLADIIGEPDEDTYLIGHSLGCITILRYLEGLTDGKKIGGVVLVAGFSNDLTFDGYKGELASFFTSAIGWAKINSVCEKFFVLHSKDDSWVNEMNYHELKQRLHAKGELQQAFGHYSSGEGLTELPIVLKSLEEMST